VKGQLIDTSITRILQNAAAETRGHGAARKLLCPLRRGSVTIIVRIATKVNARTASHPNAAQLLSSVAGEKGLLCSVALRCGALASETPSCTHFAQVLVPITLCALVPAPAWSYWAHRPPPPPKHVPWGGPVNGRQPTCVWYLAWAGQDRTSCRPALQARDGRAPCPRALLRLCATAVCSPRQLPRAHVQKATLPVTSQIGVGWNRRRLPDGVLAAQATPPHLCQTHTSVRPPCWCV
jgi:hypothetical protein